MSLYNIHICKTNRQAFIGPSQSLSFDYGPLKSHFHNYYSTNKLSPITLHITPPPPFNIPLVHINLITCSPISLNKPDKHQNATLTASEILAPNKNLANSYTPPGATIGGQLDKKLKNTKVSKLTKCSPKICQVRNILRNLIHKRQPSQRLIKANDDTSAQQYSSVHPENMMGKNVHKH